MYKLLMIIMALSVGVIPIPKPINYPVQEWQIVHQIKRPKPHPHIHCHTYISHDPLHRAIMRLCEIKR
jgi:hypothetical protein